MSFDDQFLTKILTVYDYENVKMLINKEYVENVTIHRMLKIKQSDVSDFHFKRAFEKLKLGASVGVVHKATNILVGMSLNFPSNPDGIFQTFPINKQEAEEVNTKLGQFHRFATCFNDRQSGKYNKIKTLELGMCVVRCDFTNLGIFGKMCQESLKVAQAIDCGGVVCHSTSYYIHRALQKLGFVMMDELMYEEYLDPLKNNIPFSGNIEPPHFSSRLYFKKLTK